MPKRPAPTSARLPRPKRRSTLVSPHTSSIRCTTPRTNGVRAQELFPVPSPLKASILDNRIDASPYSFTQLSWFQLNDMLRFKACFDFARCDDAILISLFPSKFGYNNQIPLSHRHTAVSIREFQELGNKQQLYLIEQDTTNHSPSPLIPELN